MQSRRSNDGSERPASADWLDLAAAAEADLLLDLHYAAQTAIVGRFRKSALVDIDPGLSQVWMTEKRGGLAEALMQVAPHDVYFTTGETVGQPGARFPDCGLPWQYTPPVVYLPEWPVTAADADAAYTTVTHWRGPLVRDQGGVLGHGKRGA